MAKKSLQLHSVSQLLRASLLLARSKFWPLFGLVLIESAIWISLSYGLPDTKAGETSRDALIQGAILVLLGGVCSIWINSALLYVAAASKSLDVFDALRLSFRKLPLVIVYSIVYILWVAIGFLLLVIPAAIFATWWAFGTFSILLESKGLRAAFRRSRTLVTGRFWPVLGRLIVLGVVSSLIQLIIRAIFQSVDDSVRNTVAIGQLTNIIYLPFATAYTYLLYRDLINATRG